jgi:hypothetical protein
MRMVYWVVAVAGAAFLGWAHDHTDELTVMFAFVLIIGGILGVLAPRRFLVSWVIAGTPIPIVETLLHYGLIGAPTRRRR